MFCTVFDARAGFDSNIWQQNTIFLTNSLSSDQPKEPLEDKKGSERKRKKKNKNRSRRLNQKKWCKY